MSKIRKIEDLSKSELLGLIYNWMPNTLFLDHPCECAVCGEDPLDDHTYDSWKGPIKIPVYIFICDECEWANELDESRNK